MRHDRLANVDPPLAGAGRAIVRALPLLAVAAACSLTPPVRSGAAPDPDVGRRPSPMPRRTGPGVGDADSPAPRAGVESRSVVDQVCRARGIPSGYIAIDFVSDESRCPQARNATDPYTAAIVTRIDAVPVGQRLVVCADQATPRDWVREGAPDEQDGRCPRPTERDDRSPRVIAIRRLR